MKELKYNWCQPIHNRMLTVTPKGVHLQWPKEKCNALLSSLSNKEAIDGGKLALYTTTHEKQAAYLVVNGYTELSELFKIEFIN